MTTDNSRSFSETPAKDEKGRFAPGNGGRPKGTRNKITREAIEGIKSLKDVAFVSLAAAVAAGELPAVIYVLDRLLPKGRTIELEGATPEDIVKALTSAEITTIEAKDIANTLAKLKNIDEIETLKERLEELERLQKEGNK